MLKHEWPGEGARLVTRINRLSSGIPLVLIVLARTLKDAAETGGFTAAEMLLTELEQEHRKGGWLGARFLSRLLPYSGEPNRKTVADVFGLSYQRLTATAQGIFRALALFSGYDFRAEAAIAVGAGDETGFAQLVNRGLVERYQDSRRYFLYDPIAEYARTLLHANADEVRVVKERYLDHFIAYVTDQERSLATVEPAEEVTALVAALRHDLVHLQVCRAMLNDTAPDDLPMTVRRLRLALPTLAIINRATADDQPDQSWFPANVATEWATTSAGRSCSSVPGSPSRNYLLKCNRRSSRALPATTRNAQPTSALNPRMQRGMPGLYSTGRRLRRGRPSPPVPHHRWLPNLETV